MQYAVNFGVTFMVEAENASDAMEQAENLCAEEWGKTFYREAWASDPEPMEA